MNRGLAYSDQCRQAHDIGWIRGSPPAAPQGRRLRPHCLLRVPAGPLALRRAMVPLREPRLLPATPFPRYFCPEAPSPSPRVSPSSAASWPGPTGTVLNSREAANLTGTDDEPVSEDGPPERSALSSRPCPGMPSGTLLGKATILTTGAEPGKISTSRVQLRLFVTMCQDI
jgi:hypothetical protein